MDRLDLLESQSVYILREAFNRIDRLAMLWSPGKDTNVMVWLARKAFFGHVPFPVIHIDTGKKFAEMYAFRDRFAKEWELNLLCGECSSLAKMDPSLPKAEHLAARMEAGLKAVIEQQRFEGVFAGIRRDEEGTRTAERYFSPRDAQTQWDFKDPSLELWGQFDTDFPPGTPLRIHPLLHWTEIDIWRYTLREGIPIVPLYFARNGRRYRSLGDQDIAHPIVSTAATVPEIIAELEATKLAERSGPGLDRQPKDPFERLRADGYM